MAKGDLIGGTLWDQYSTKVADRMNNPRHLGEITPEEAQKLNAELIVADHGGRKLRATRYGSTGRWSGNREK